MTPKEMTIFTRRRKRKSSKGNKYLYKRYKTKYSALSLICPVPCSLRKRPSCPCAKQEGAWETGDTALLIHNLRIRWRSAISLTPRTLCSRRKHLRFPTIQAWWASKPIRTVIKRTFLAPAGYRSRVPPRSLTQFKKYE